MTNPIEMEKALRSALDAHGKWKLRMKTAMTTRKSDVDPETAACDDKCDFGKWLYSNGIGPDVKSGMPYQVVRRLHAEFHHSAGNALEAALAGRRRKKDKETLVEFDERSAKLIKALSKWLGEIRAE